MLQAMEARYPMLRHMVHALHASKYVCNGGRGGARTCRSIFGKYDIERTNFSIAKAFKREKTAFEELSGLFRPFSLSLRVFTTPASKTHALLLFFFGKPGGGQIPKKERTVRDRGWIDPSPCLRPSPCLERVRAGSSAPPGCSVLSERKL